MGEFPTTSRASSLLLENGSEQFDDIVRGFHSSAPFPVPGVDHDLVSQSPQQLASFQSSESSIQKFINKVGSKLKKGARSDSAFVGLYIANQINNFRLGFTNNEMTPEGNFVSAPDMGRMINSSMNSIISTWTFLSTRAALVPEGNTVLQRMKTALENMDKSQVQVRDMLSMGGGIASILEHGMKGFKLSQQLKNRQLVKNGGQATEVIFDKTRLMQGGLGLVGMMLNIYALFGPEAARKQQKERITHEAEVSKLANLELRPFKESVSLPFAGRMKQKMKMVVGFFKSNPMLMLNSLISVSIAVALGIEGRTKVKEQARMFGKVEDFTKPVQVQIGKKDVKTIDASTQLFSSIFGVKDMNAKIRALAQEEGITVQGGKAQDFLQAFKDSGGDSMQKLNGLIPDGKKALNEAGTRAIKSSFMGIALNIWGQVFRARQVLQADAKTLGTAR